MASTDTGSVGSREVLLLVVVAASRHPTDTGSVEMQTVTVEVTSTHENHQN